jgi:flagellin FlaB
LLWDENKESYRRDVNQMGKITKKLKADDIGDMGIGAMIVFIAMVLVAGIAASVLIQTANKLEIQAMTTGQQTTDEVSTGLHVLSIEGTKNGNVIAHIGITVSPRSGSKDVDLSQTYIEISDTTTKCVLTYAQAGFNLKGTINGDLFQNAYFTPLNATRFGVVVLEDADNSLQAATPVVNQGDKVMLTADVSLCFTAAHGISLRDTVFGLVQPEEGASGAFSFTAPSSVAGNTVFNLY